ncbi:MAG: NADH-quinone oxidoreductase subunit L [Acidimicrobiales bacterium]|nr:NADH-quinone oxidoreductase subunit L [Acidimicrobiales bacterium]
MEQLLDYAWLVVALPFAAAVLIGAFGKLMPLKGSEIGIAAVFVAWLISLGIGGYTFVNGPIEAVESSLTWAPMGSGFEIQLGQYVDGLTAMMLVLVTTVSLGVQLYSREYMHGEERFTYFFAMLSLFTFSMLVLVVANNTLQAVVGWELVGLCSFLLIGFYWHEKPNQDAANKAFLTTKFADIGLIVGVIVLSAGVAQTGSSTPFDIETTIDAAMGGELSTATIVLGCLMIFLGAVGKSGQMPLHVWLPDAMAGPTPVSALIHAATMVTAGVFLVARLYPVFAQSLVVMNTVAIVGVITLFFAGFVALVQDDIKKVLAYSTVSQLGYMMAALGVGGYTAGIFHLFTHGFFKALLFLGSGSLIHAVHSNNMSDMGGMRKYMPWTFATFIIGSLALAGFPLTAGFFSKDEVLVAAQIWGDAGFTMGTVVFWLGLAGAAVTTFYMARACFLIFFGEHRGVHHAAVPTHDEHADEHTVVEHAVEAEEAEAAAHDHAGAVSSTDGHDVHHGSPHESGWQILVPLVMLAVLSFPVGFAGGFLWDEVGGSTERNFETWTATHDIEETTYPFAAAAEAGAEGGEAEEGHALAGADGEVLAAGALAAEGGEEHGESLHVLHGAPEFHLDVFVYALIAFLVAVGGAWVIYGRGMPARDPTFRLGPVTTLLVNKYYFDDLGYRFVVVPVRDKLSPAASWTSNVVIDGIVKRVGGAAKRLGAVTYTTLDQKVIDGGINGAAFSAAWWSDKLRRIQSGDVQRYAGALLAGTIVLVLVFSAAR